MIDKIEKDGSIIFVFSEMNKEEDKLVNLIKRFVDGDIKTFEEIESHVHNKSTDSSEPSSQKDFDCTEQEAEDKTIKQKNIIEHDNSNHKVTPKEAYQAIVYDGVSF